MKEHRYTDKDGKSWSRRESENDAEKRLLREIWRSLLRAVPGCHFSPECEPGDSVILFISRIYA